MNLYFFVIVGLYLCKALAEKTRGSLHFMFLCYDRMHNGELWEYFFSSAPREAYTISIQHSKPEFKLESWPSSLLDKSKVFYYSNSTFRYARYVYAADHLLGCALNGSREGDLYDQFLLLSSDAVPIVKFQAMFSRLVSHDHVKQSSLCITATNQWIQRMNTTEWYVKHHNWWALNRENASYAHEVFQTMASHGEQEEDLFGRETHGFMSKDAKQSKYATEEFWHYKALFGNFDTQRHPPETNPYHLQFPSTQTKGYCLTYVNWGSASVHDDSNVFARASAMWRMKEHFMDGIHISRLPLRVVMAIYNKTKYPQDFLLLRKVSKKTVVYLDNDLKNTSECNIISFSHAFLSRNLLL